MKAIVALCAAVALSGCAYNDPYLYSRPYSGAPPAYYGDSPYYYYGYGATVPYGYGPFGYDYPGYYYPDVRPGSPWSWQRPHPRPDGTAGSPRTPRPEGGGSGYPAPPPVSSGGGGSGYNPGASNAGSTGGGGSGYVPNQPPDK
jgi:hypothetical protein